ncbi:MAG: glycosyltransferase family 9 protein [Bacteroidota bacterium]
MSSTYERILVIQTAFIGDVILATSLLEKLHQYFPDSQLSILVRKGNESLFKGHPYLHQVIIWNKKKKKYKNLYKVVKGIRKARYDLVINLQRFSSTGFITAFSSAKYTIGFHKNPLAFTFSKKILHSFQEGWHETERNQALIVHLTDQAVCKPRLYPTVADEMFVKSYLTPPYICIAPTSVWFTKQWPAEKWIALLDQLPAYYQVYLLGAPNDRKTCHYIIEKSTRVNVTNLAGQLTLLQSAALMARAVMNYVNDSAPMHLASAMDAPTCAVYCSTIPQFGFYPLATQAHVAEIPTRLACRPCGIHGHTACPEGHFQCAHQIQLQQLLAVLP